MKKLLRGEKKRSYVRQMFDRIAPKYDFMNRLISFGLDQRWRRKGLESVNVGTKDILVDIACGTGDIVELASSMGATAIGLDFSSKMLYVAKLRNMYDNFIQGDACLLPFKNASIDVVTCGFALRNFADLGNAIEEMGRALVPGGRLMFLEVCSPKNPLLKAGHAFYFQKVVPFIGAVLADKNAYAYLPQSVAYLPPVHELFALLHGAGFSNVRRKMFFLNAAQLITGIRK
ncbi:MAG: ubiquinone/menaquinone biosynthesis methyltransferase [Thermodesulfobacteriota bacterium]|nr:ubiquinone/menaquinone biosynthesis methyltransferase [Thermodesulfobacteriota bacterium]